MNLLSQTYDSLIDIKYFGQNEENIDEFEKRVKNVVEFSKIVSFLSKRLKRLLPDIEEFVNPIDSDDEKNTLFLEICSLLKELSCPYKAFSEGDIHARFDSLENKLQLIDFLLSEVQAAQIIAVSKKSQSSSEHGSVRSDESEETKALKQILTTLGIPKPPVHVTVNEIWAKIEQKLQSLLTTLPKSHLGKPLFNAMLSEDQWKKLMEINQLLCEDFQMRRELLLTRLDVTVQSFKWADRLKSSNQEIATIYQSQRRQLSSKPGVKLFMLLSARDDLCKQEKTCSSRLMTRSNLHKIIIPKVPDRGGRTGELQPPPPEMPAFMQRRNTPGGQQHHQQQPQDQRRQGGRGGRNQGNNYWCNEGPNFRPKSEFEKFNDPNYGDNSGRGNGGGHGGGRGGYRGGGGGGGGGYRGGGRGGRY